MMTAAVARNVNDTVIKGYGISGSATTSQITRNTIFAEIFVDDLDFAVLGLCLVQELVSSKICLADVIVGRFEEKKTCCHQRSHILLANWTEHGLVTDTCTHRPMASTADA